MTEDELRNMTMEELMAAPIEQCESYQKAGRYMMARPELNGDESIVIRSIVRTENALGEPTLCIITYNGQHHVWGIPERYEQWLINFTRSGGKELGDVLSFLDRRKYADDARGKRWPD
jgi:hypothetical protein